MKTLLRLLLDLCLLRIGPQDLPYSPALTRGLVVLSVGLSALFVLLVGDGQRDLSQLGLSVILLLVLPWLLLRMRGRDSRYAQTLAALAGTGVLFTLVTLPIAIMLVGMPISECHDAADAAADHGHVAVAAHRRLETQYQREHLASCTGLAQIRRPAAGAGLFRIRAHVDPCAVARSRNVAGDSVRAIG